MKSIHRAGFTLVEMMVSLAVLGILLLIMGQLITAATKTISHTATSLYVNKDASTELDLIQRDFSGISNRPDIDCILFKPTTTTLNDCLYFYSSSSTYFDGSSFSSSQKNGVSLVGYRINCQSTSNNGYIYNGLSSYGQLERLGKSLAWEQSISTSWMPYLSYYSYSGPSSSWGAIPLTTIAGAGYVSADGKNTVGTAGAQYTDGLDSNYSVVGSRTFRLELSYLLKDGSQSNVPIENPNYSSTIQDNLAATRPPMASDDSTASYGVGSRWFDTNAQIGYECLSSTASNAVWTHIGLSDLQAIVVTVAIIPNTPIVNPSNAQSAVIAQAESLDINSLASKFPKATTNPHGSYTDIAGILLNNWNSVISAAASGTTPIAGLPSSVAANIHVYQRFIYL